MLHLLSKIFERIISVKFLLPAICGKVDESQFAYISGRGKGTAMANTTIYLNCLKFLDQQSGCVRMVTLDIKKAFDRLTHCSIVKPCVRFDIPKNLAKLIIS